MTTPVHTAPEGSPAPILGKTLVDILYDTAEKYRNPRLLNQPAGGTWKPFSLEEFRNASEEIAAGLRAIGLEQGDKVGLYMDSDAYFCLADMGCLLAGCVNVPMYVTLAEEAAAYVLDHSEARAVFVSSPERLEEMKEILPKTPEIRCVIVADAGGEELSLEGGDAELLTMEALRAKGRERIKEDPGLPEALAERVEADDLATLIYTSGTTGQPKGVMLTHENISSNALSALEDFNHRGEYRPGSDGEVAISFLPLTHIYARMLHYGFIAQGTSVYFTTPEELAEDLKKVRPTVFATVPRLLEKVYARIQERTQSMTGVKKALGLWALNLARKYELGREPTGLYKAKLRLADRLVFSKWREALGGRARLIISGGAALNAELANVFNAAGINLVQGYGLTETSPVIAVNRVSRNRAGTVGEPIPGVEVKIAPDGEILTRGPHIMKGYYKNPEQTRRVLSEDGWFHTGDIGSFTEEGFLRITDRKKALFKLSTGKYVTPQPIENRLALESLIEHAVVLGEEHKFCTALLFVEPEALRAFAQSMGINGERSLEEIADDPTVRAHVQTLVDKANRGMDRWSTVKRFAIIPEALTIDDEMLTPTLKVRRARVLDRYADRIEALYSEDYADPERHAPPPETPVSP